jgi:hypothetical protein
MVYRQTRALTTDGELSSSTRGTPCGASRSGESELSFG